ncbi:hypothetical protein [Streptomyces sp. WAC06614]|uniref:hypothetical protein n=1 Tax=Streptomyces sp. WAC06614 TaxID=2487416 RepID=UPI000F76959B|nr:hypothetical protein [Streptomyces sp. WAC06614]RSS79385.1 hypothetical protein EF918_17575 [Streptomyces sp. WAC06614]
MYSCIACEELFSMHHHEAGALFKCPKDCTAFVLCKKCFASYRVGEFLCLRCEAALEDNEGVPAKTLRTHALIGMEAVPSPGCPQEGKQCYAAATATACNWAVGTELTTDEAMHLYLMSEQAAGEVVEVYRTAYAAAEERVGAHSPVAEVHAAMPRVTGGATALHLAVCAYGVPVFPEGVVHQYLPRLSGEVLKAAFDGRCTVMLASGSGLHWVVCYAAEIDTAGDVVVLHGFDPYTGEHYATEWCEELGMSCEGYVVGAELG